MTHSRASALAFLSGALLVLSFPRPGLDFLVWVALVPLFFALRGAMPGFAFRLGMITGLTFNIGLIYWIVHVVSHYGNLSFPLSCLVMLLFALYLSLYQGIFAWAVTLMQSRGIPMAVAAPVLWTSLEYSKSHLFTGFPWENVGYALYSRTSLIQIADVVGVYGLTFLIVLINSLVLALLLGGSRRSRVLQATVILVVLLTVQFYGAWRIATVTAELRDAPSLTVALAQGNIDQSIKWDEGYQQETLQIYGELSRQGGQLGADLVIWPETAAPIFFQNVNEHHRAILAVARDAEAFLLFGSPGYTFLDGEQALLNSAWLISPEGTVVDRYDKTHLVPFGEYVPLRRILFFVDKLVEGFADFIPGETLRPLEINENGVAVGVLICYEGIFPGISRTAVRKGADYLVNITNDAWYGRTSAPYQHLSMLPLRAVENRRSIARAANTGVSALIDPVGRISEPSELFEKALVVGTLKRSTRSTPYSRYGDLFALGCIIATAVSALYARRQRDD